MSKRVVYSSIKYFLFFVLFYLFSVADIHGIKPFAFGMLFALVWCNQKIYIITPLYLLAGCLACCSVNSVISLSATCFVFVMFYFLHKKFKKPLNKTLIGLYAFLSQGVHLFLNSGNGDVFFKAVCELVLGIICLYAYLFLFQSLLTRGLKRKFLLDEAICAGVFCVALGVSFCSVWDYNGLISKFLCVFVSFVMSLFLSPQVSMPFCSLIGVGSMMIDGDPTMFVLLSMMSVILLLTSKSKRIFSVFGVLLIDVFTNLYLFNYYSIYLFLPTIATCILVLCFPQKTIQKIRNAIITKTQEFSVRELVNSTRHELVKKLYKTEVVFKEMQNIYLNMNKSHFGKDEALDYVLNRLNQNICQKCSKKASCPLGAIMQTDNELKTLVALSVSRGKVGVCDVSSRIMKNCGKVPILINEINTLSKEFCQSSLINSTAQSFRQVAADQLGGTVDVLKRLEADINKTVSFDVSLEEKIVEELGLIGLTCVECVVLFEEENIKSVFLCVLNKKFNKGELEKCVSSITKTKMSLFETFPSKRPGYLEIKLHESFAYNISYGVSQKTKYNSPVSGDTYSAIKLNDQNVFMSICDGMGSGKQAKSLSELSLNLVEKFYEAGFDDNLILNNVNKLLSLRNEDSFSALDICCFNLLNGTCSLIKIGASIGFLKLCDETKIIETSALPLGIVENIVPSTKSFALNDGDMVILLSDGVVDAWEDITKLKDLINNIETKNPQVLADIILRETLSLTQNYAEDDMTVLVGKIWKKI